MKILDNYYIYRVKKFLIPTLLKLNPTAKVVTEPRVTRGGLYLPATMKSGETSVFAWDLPEFCSAIFRPGKHHYIVWKGKIAIEIVDEDNIKGD